MPTVLLLSLSLTFLSPSAVVWSNYSDGGWDIYMLDKNRIKRLTNTPYDEFYPRFSHNGKWIYFVRKKDGFYTIHRMTRKGVVDGWMIDNGHYFSLVEDDRMIYQAYEGRRAVVMWKNLVSGKTTRDHVNDIPKLAAVSLYQPDSTPDGKTKFILSGRAGWTVERTPGIEGNLSPVGKGCRPAVSPDGKWAAYVSNTGNGGTSIRAQNVATGEDIGVVDMPGNISHEYDPKFSNDGKWLVFSACPNGQHSAEKGAEYRLFIYEWGSGNSPGKFVDLPGADSYPDVYIDR